jgi:hypothetical protein
MGLSIESVAKITHKTEDEVKKVYLDRLEHCKNVIGIKDGAEDIALNMAMALLRQNMNIKGTQREALIFGIANRTKDNAEWERAGIADFISKNGEDKAREKGILRADGTYLYSQDNKIDFKKGTPVPEHEYTTVVDALVEIDGKPTFAVITVPGLKGTESVKINSIMKFHGGNVKQREGFVSIYSTNGAPFEFVKAMDVNKVWETVKKYVKISANSVEELCAKIDNESILATKYEPVLLRNLVARTVIEKKDGCGYGIELETCQANKYKTIKVWTGKLDFVPQAGIPTNVYGHFSKYEPDNVDTITLNARSVWYDNAFKVDKPKPIAEVQKEW